MSATRVRLGKGIAVLATSVLVAGITRDWWLIPLGAAAGASALLLADELDVAHRAQAERLLQSLRGLERELAGVSPALRAASRVSEQRLSSVGARAQSKLRQHQALEARWAVAAGAAHREELRRAADDIQRELQGLGAVFDESAARLVSVGHAPPDERPTLLADALVSLSLSLDRSLDESL